MRLTQTGVRPALQFSTLGDVYWYDSREGLPFNVFTIVLASGVLRMKLTRAGLLDPGPWTETLMQDAWDTHILYLGPMIDDHPSNSLTFQELFLNVEEFE